jgi:hypothetical protein
MVWPKVLLLMVCGVMVAGPLYGECTQRDRESLAKAGMSGYEIARICGDITDPVIAGEDGRVRPKRPDTHGRLQERSTICQTAVGWCVVEQEGPPGLACRCRTPQGVYEGVLVRR